MLLCPPTHHPVPHALRDRLHRQAEQPPTARNAAASNDRSTPALDAHAVLLSSRPAVSSRRRRGAQGSSGAGTQLPTLAVPAVGRERNSVLFGGPVVRSASVADAPCSPNAGHGAALLSPGGAELPALSQARRDRVPGRFQSRWPGGAPRLTVVDPAPRLLELAAARLAEKELDARFLPGEAAVLPPRAPRPSTCFID